MSSILRMECLGRRLRSSTPEIDVLANADATVVAKAARIVSALPSLRACSDVAALRAPIRPPADAAMRVRVDKRVAARSGDGRQLGREIRRGGAPRGTHPRRRARDRLPPTRGGGPRRARERPVPAWRRQDGDEDASRRQRSLRAQVATRRQSWRPSASSVFLGGRYGQYKEAHAWAQRGLAAFDSIGGNDELPLAYLLLGRGTLLAIEGKFEEALADDRRALAIREKGLGPNHLKTAAALEAVARVLGDLGRYQEQEQVIRRSLAISEKEAGPDHPETASALFNLAFAVGAQGRHDEAIADYKRVVENWERNLGKDSSRLSIPVNNIAWNFMVRASSPKRSRTSSARSHSPRPRAPNMWTSRSRWQPLATCTACRASRTEVSLAITERSRSGRRRSDATISRMRPC